MDLLTGKVKEPKKKMLKRKVRRAPYQLADPSMEAIMMGSKKPYNTENLAFENKKKRMLRRAGFFNPLSASRDVERRNTLADDVQLKYNSTDMSEVKASVDSVKVKEKKELQRKM